MAIRFLKTGSCCISKRDEIAAKTSCHADLANAVSSSRRFPDFRQRKIPTCYKIGNRDIVRAMAECNEILNLIGKDDTYANSVRRSGERSRRTSSTPISGSERSQTFNLAEVATVTSNRDAATAAIDEFDKVVRVRRNTAEQYRQTPKSATDEAVTQGDRANVSHRSTISSSRWPICERSAARSFR